MSEHILCTCCFNTFTSPDKSNYSSSCTPGYRTISCKLCLQLPSEPWNTTDRTTKLILQTHRRSINQQKQLKLEREKYQSESLKVRNEINNLKQKNKLLKNVAIKYKTAYQKLKNKVLTLEAENKEKNRQFNNVNEKYTEMLKKKSHRKSRKHTNIYINSLNNLNYISQTQS
eukprot:408503_1